MCRYLAGEMLLGRVSNASAIKALKADAGLSVKYPKMKQRDCGVSDGGSIIVTIDEGDDHLECEVLRTGKLEWFYRHREEGNMDIWDTDDPALLPPWGDIFERFLPSPYTKENV